MKGITGFILITGFLFLACGNHRNTPTVGQYIEMALSQIDTDSIHKTIYPPSKRNIYPPDSPHHPGRVIDMDTIKMPADTGRLSDSGFYHK